MKDSKNDIISFMEIKLANNELALDLLKATDLLKSAKDTLNESGLKITAEKLSGIIEDLNQSINNSSNLKEVLNKINNNFTKIAIDVKFDDELLKLDLSDNEIKYLEDIVLSEMEFEDEID